MFYFSFGGEVETPFMIKEAQQFGKTVLLPVIDEQTRSLSPGIVRNLDEDVEVGPFGIPCPKENLLSILPKNEIDLVIVPGLAFDRKLYRLGRGHGFYDRFLSELGSKIVSIGLAYDFQLVPFIPALEAHDIPLTRVISN